MSLAEIKAELPKLTPAERAELRRALIDYQQIDDPGYWAETDLRVSEMERGMNVVSKEEMYARLQAAGRSL